nr:hypothetical protein [Tanacetum cinerariifolium]
NGRGQDVEPRREFACPCLQRMTLLGCFYVG